MSSNSEWEEVRGVTRARFGLAGSSLLRATLLFGFAIVALTLVLVPVADNQVRSVLAHNEPLGVDRMTTGSVGRRGIYTIRRSVLQSSPDAICVIGENGSASGDC